MVLAVAFSPDGKQLDLKWVRYSEPVKAARCDISPPVKPDLKGFAQELQR